MISATAFAQQRSIIPKPDLKQLCHDPSSYLMKMYRQGFEVLKTQDEITKSEYRSVLEHEKDLVSKDNMIHELGEFYTDILSNQNVIDAIEDACRDRDEELLLSLLN